MSLPSAPDSSVVAAPTPADQRVDLNGRAYPLQWLTRTADGQQILAEASRLGASPGCLCGSRPLPMHIVRRGAHYYIARLPGTGPLHAHGCPSRDDANFFSGITCYDATALSERPDGGYDVALGQYMPRGVQLQLVGLEGLLDLLIELAELNFRSPGAPVGGWPAIRKRLLEAAALVCLRDHGHSPLSDHLLCPFPFDRDQYEGRRELYVRLLSSSTQRFVLAPLRAIRDASLGTLLILKHMPDFRFYLPSRTGASISLLSASPSFALVLARLATPRTRPGFAVIEEVAIRRTDATFFPSGSDDEDEVLKWLTCLGRPFSRPLRFEAPLDHPLADFALMDGPSPHPVFVLAHTSNENADQAKRSAALALVRNGCVGAAVWEGGTWINPPMAFAGRPLFPESPLCVP